MHLDLYLTREYLKAGVLVSLLSVWVLVGLFFYLNRYTKRAYFTVWTAAWLFYALWITLSFGVEIDHERPWLLMLQHWCVGVSAVFLLWGSLRFLGHKVRSSLLGWFMAFLLTWSYIGAFHLHEPWQMEIPIFWLIAGASVFTAGGFFRYRQKHPYVGATLLSLGFTLWGLYMASYPFLESSSDLTSVALFISAALQLMLAVSMIILVLEEARQIRQLALEEAQTSMIQRDAMETRALLTEERYRKLFDLASEAIVITSKEDFRILELNQAALRLLGISQKDAGNHCLTAFCQIKNPGEPTPQTPAELFQVICRQRPLNLVRTDGGVTPLEVNGSEVDFGGRPAYQFFMFEVTEKARLEQQLRQAEKLSALGQMISGVAHELNNPLAVVKGYLELILAHHELAPQTRADLEKVAHESNRAAKLVTNFLSFAREQPALRESVDLNKIVRRMIELRKFDLLIAKTEVSLEFDPQLPAVLADPSQMDQLVINLVNNALQAMMESPKQGRLSIVTRMAGDRVHLVVADNGPGVPEELVSKIFEPFFTTKEVGTGTGLGLSIAHSIMAEHGGRIYYEKSSLGGAAFVLDFPASDGTAMERPTESNSTEIFYQKTPPVKPAKILVLDDEKSLAEMLAEMLGLLGYTTTISNAAAHALQLIEQEDFDLIISDFRMPGINGEQFHGLVAQHNPALARRIIFLTGDMVNPETLGFLTSIGNPHLAKPFQLENVKRTVAEVLRANTTPEAAE